ncbi:hypothetical protein MBLNU457_3538t1 [Dothideomycetes sp. NU457]
MSETPKDPIGYADTSGQFKRKASTFRSWISSEPGAEFPPEKSRYVLYINYGCPWAHRANLVRSLKGLEDIIEVVVMSFKMSPEGWMYDGSLGTAAKDPYYGFTRHRDLYIKADPDFSGRYTVPTLWDKKRETIVNNESSEIIRMFYSAFDSLLPAERQEANKPSGGLLPPALKSDIDTFNEWTYDMLNNGVYKAGFAGTQDAYEENVVRVFEGLDRLEAHIAQGKGPYLFGEHITEADIRVYPTIVRFDMAYHTIFKCNLKMIRHDYPGIHKWLRVLYWDQSEETRGAFGSTTYPEHIKRGYVGAVKANIVPKGPLPHVLPLDA